MEIQKKRIIGIAGFARSGKDTLADYLCHDHGCTKTHFADAIKKQLKEIFNFTDEQLWGSEKEKPDERYPISGICPRDRAHCERQSDGSWRCPTCKNAYGTFLTARLAMQTLGTEWGRTMYPNIWIDCTMRFIQESAQRANKDRWVIADVRMWDEVHRIKEIGGIVVRMHRKMPQKHLWHATESELAEMPDSLFDIIVHNDGSVAALQEEAKRVAQRAFRV